MPKSGKVIVLNGCSSVGKSSTAKALQAITREPFLHLQGDSFLEMLPESMLGHPDGIIFHPATKSEGVVLEMGEVCDRAFSGMRRAVAAMAAEGNNIIVDDVVLSLLDQQAYLVADLDIRPLFVGLFAPLDVLERRERDRGDRMIGLARWQFERVHKGIKYDLEIDNSAASPKDCAEEIAEKLRLK